MRFNQILPYLINFELCSRYSWDSGIYIFRQVPSQIEKSMFSKMTSLPESVKELLNERITTLGLDNIKYDNQIVKIDKNNNISAYSFSGEDIMADDWSIEII